MVTLQNTDRFQMAYNNAKVPLSDIRAAILNIEDGTAQGQLYYWDATQGKVVPTATNKGIYDVVTGNWGFGTATPRQKLDVLDASNPQLRLTYTDNSVYTDFQTDSSGYLTLTPSGGAITIDGGSTGSPNVLTVLGTKDPTNFFVKNNTAANVSNLAKVSLLLNTDAQSRGSFEFRAGFNNIADGSRNTAGEIRVAENGSFKDAMAFDGTLVGFNTTSPRRRIDSLDTSNPQLRLTHTDNFHFTDFQTDSSGYLTVSPTGGRVGIGRIPTEAGLQVQSNIATAGNFKFLNNTGGILDQNNNQIFYHSLSLNEVRFSNAYVGGFITYYTSGTEKMRVTATGKVGIGVTVPTAYLHLKAGTAIAGTAPLKFTSGALLTVPEPGAMNYVDDKFYVTCVGTQRVIDRTSDVKTTTTTVTNTTTETTVYTGAIPANSLRAGNILKLNMSGQIDNASAADTMTIRVKFGGITLATIVSPAAGLANECWHIVGFATLRSIGATGSMAWHLDMDVAGSSDDACGVSTVDTTAAEDVTVTAQWNNAKTGNIFNLTQGFLEYKN